MTKFLSYLLNLKTSCPTVDLGLLGEVQRIIIRPSFSILMENFVCFRKHYLETLGKWHKRTKTPPGLGEIPKMFGFSRHNGETATFLTTSGKTPNMGDWGCIPDTKLARQHVQKVTTLYNTLPQID